MRQGEGGAGSGAEMFGIGFLPIGFLLSRRMLRASAMRGRPVALAIRPRLAAASSEAGSSHLFGPTPGWFGALLAWLWSTVRPAAPSQVAGRSPAAGRSTESASSLPVSQASRSAVPAADDLAEVSLAAYQPVRSLGHPTQPPGPPLRLELPRPQPGLPLSLRWPALAQRDTAADARRAVPGVTREVSDRERQPWAPLVPLLPLHRSLPAGRETGLQAEQGARPEAASKLHPEERVVLPQEDMADVGESPLCAHVRRPRDGVPGPERGEALSQAIERFAFPGPARKPLPELSRQWAATGLPEDGPGRPVEAGSNAPHLPESEAGVWRASPLAATRRPVGRDAAEHDLELPGDPGQFRSAARDVTLLVSEVTRIVQENLRAEERMRPVPPAPQRAQPPATPQIDPAEMFRLAQRESRERAFRMGR